ncbi:hypothetical protein ACP70R_026891 [Stipagrostis hirtigluma subsp. patula]
MTRLLLPVAWSPDVEVKADRASPVEAKADGGSFNWIRQTNNRSLIPSSKSSCCISSGGSTNDSLGDN